MSSKSSPPPGATGDLSDEQVAALDRIVAGWDVFKDGPAPSLRDLRRHATNGNGTSPERRVTSTAASEMEPEEIRWALRYWIPLGTSSILSGPPKATKSTWSGHLAADISQGRAEGDLQGEPADVVILSYEDHPTATIVPRLIAAGADLRRVHILSPTVTEADGSADLVTLTTDLERIEAECALYRVRLLIIDPLMASLAGSTDSHRDQDIRRAMAPVGQMAERLDMAALVITHTTKARDGDMIRRIGASVGLSGAARSLLIMGPHPEDPDGADGTRKVLVSRGNLAPPQPGREYGVESHTIRHGDQQIETSRLRYVGEVDVASHDLLAPPEPEERTERDDAADYLAAELKDGPRPVRDILADADGAGISERTLRRAKAALGIEAVRESKGSSGRGCWLWTLPQDGHPSTHTGGSLAGNGSREPNRSTPKAATTPKAAKTATPKDAGNLAPPCRYIEHRSTDYSDQGGKTICGTCHPRARAEA